MHATIQKSIEEIISSIRVFVENAARFGRPVQLGVVVLKSPQMGWLHEPQRLRDQRASGVDR